MVQQVTGYRDAGAVDNVVEMGITGTVHLVDLDGSMGAVHDKSQKDVVLYPTPSSDPNDPLNWSQKRKWLNSFCLQLYTFMIAGGTATGYAVYPQIIESTGIPLSTLNSAIGVMFLILGWGCLFWCPIGLQYGRRGVYLISLLGCMAMNLWAPYTASAGTWYAHRFLYGFFGAPVEALVEQSMPDMFFTHERGLHVGLFLMWLGGASFLFPIAAGYVAQTMDWRWCFYFPVIFMGASLVFLYFFMDETMYDRSLMQQQALERGRAARAVSVPASAESQEAQLPSKEMNSEEKSAQTPSETSANLEAAVSGEILIYEPMTLSKRLALFKVTPGKENKLWAMMIRPMKHVITFPIMAMAGFQYGTYLMFFVVLNATWTTILQAEPYNFSPGITGVAYVAPFLGALTGSAYSGWFGDRFHLWMARRNGGIREPEQRLWLYIACSLGLMTGLLLWGVGSGHIHWFGVLFGAFLLGFTGVLGGASPIAYISDSYPMLLGEGMITMTLIRNTMGFAMGYAITPFFENVGIRNTFITCAFLALGLTSTFFIFIFVGKAERKRTTAKYHQYAANATMTH